MKFVKEKHLERKCSPSSLRKALAPDGDEAPDGVDAQVGEVVHKVDVEDEAEALADEVDPDVHVDGYDLHMSIYLQPIIVFITFFK